MGHVIGEPNFPRRGSMQFWPRKRAKRIYPVINTIPKLKNAIPSSFSGYKVGMTHITIIDNIKNSPSKGQEITVPVTIVECPPINVFSIRFYKKIAQSGYVILSQVNSTEYAKELNRKLQLKSKKQKEAKKPLSMENVLKDVDKIERVSIIVHSNPKMVKGINGKKKPEIMEIIMGGTVKEAIIKSFEFLGKQIKVEDVFTEGEQLDIFSVTTGKGFQGSVKRFGVKIGRHKAEKVKRKAMTLGAWTPCKVDHRVPQHGQMGFQTRCDYNKWLMKIIDPKEVLVKGGYINYGNPQNTVLLIKGSIPGPKKRLIRIRKSIRPSKKLPTQVPEIVKISTSSKQGRGKI